MNPEKFYNDYWDLPDGAPPEALFAFVERKEKLQTSLRSLPIGCRILDAGCGDGTFTNFLLSIGYSVFGVDISIKAIDKAKMKYSANRFTVASIERSLPYETGSFSGIWCTEVVEHIFDVHETLSEFNRVLKQNGFLILTVPYHGLLKNLLISIFGFERHFNPYLSHIRFFSKKSITRCLNQAGFQVIKVTGVGRFWPVWMSQFVIAKKVSYPNPAPAISG